MKAYKIINFSGEIEAYVSGKNINQAKLMAFYSMKENGYVKRYIDVAVRRFYKYDPIAAQIRYPIGYSYAEDLLFKYEQRAH